MLQNKFLEIYFTDIRPLEDWIEDFIKLTIDEQLLAFQGRVFFKQYNPAKPAKWGILFRTLASSIDHYIMSFDWHAGKYKNRAIDVMSIVQRLLLLY